MIDFLRRIEFYYINTLPNDLYRIIKEIKEQAERQYKDYPMGGI